MLLTKMKLGKPLEIFINREGYRYRVVSKIEDVCDDRVCVTLIESRTRVFRFLDTDEVEFVYRDEERMWIWKNVKGGIVQLDGTPCHCLLTSREGESYNRREAYRVFIGENVKFLVQRLKQEATAEDGDGFEVQEFVGFIKDVSESGVGLFSDAKLEPQEEIQFLLPTLYGDLECKAEVVRIDEQRQGNYRFYYGCYLTQSDRRLLKYIFHLQRQQLQNAKKKNEKD